MKKFILASLAACTVLYADTFMKPVDSYVVVGYNTDTCYFCNGKHHTGIDYSQNGSHKIVATNDGVVVKVGYNDGHDHGMGNNVIIKHILENGKVVYSTYSHLDSILPHIKAGYKIKRGEQVGVMGGTGYGKAHYWGRHLHFEMKIKPVTGSPLHGTYWGYTPYSADYHGYLNPNDYFGKVKVKEESDGKIQGIFQGAGSLVAPNDDCYGCNKDIVRLHKENGIGSIGVFQWKYDPNSCSHLDIYSDANLGEVVIKSKSWGNDYIHKAFKVKLQANKRVSLKPDDKWTTFAVMTKDALPVSAANLYAECKTESDVFYRGDRVSVPTTPVDVTYGYDWTGTGSLITRSNEPENAFGKEKDIANIRTVDGKNALTTFQWYADATCNEVVVSAGEASSYVYIQDLSIKKWNEPNTRWKKQNCTMLPCNVSVSEDGYYILKIGSLKNVYGTGAKTIKVSCTH